MEVEVLIGQSYYLRFDSKLWKAMQPYPPSGELYAARYVRSRGGLTFSGLQRFPLRKGD